ncbi:hypothetical protein GLYMA_01G078350v4 [Glycine max]|nr:hypothetical protein GLYMA_01G078350v4 [Glycine max]KAG4403297.1 hypothetical protein GLYMA_01G078350v4 [Glycine max]KAH1162119.1 hypothetical protein GYH30_000838 [Glycine max]KAH1162120.1 hypothetical protein GYH30_000838 [Glycine max]
MAGHWSFILSFRLVTLSFQSFLLVSLKPKKKKKQFGILPSPFCMSSPTRRGVHFFLLPSFIQVLLRFPPSKLCLRHQGFELLSI